MKGTELFTRTVFFPTIKSRHVCQLFIQNWSIYRAEEKRSDFSTCAKCIGLQNGSPTISAYYIVMSFYFQRRNKRIVSENFISRAVFSTLPSHPVPLPEFSDQLIPEIQPFVSPDPVCVCVVSSWTFLEDSRGKRSRYRSNDNGLRWKCIKARTVPPRFVNFSRY